jgi:arylformamidase
MHLIDLSQTIEPGMSLFSPTMPQPEVKPWLSHAQSKATGNYEDCTCEITEVKFLTSVGTYMDSPYHFNPKGMTIERLRLEQVVLPGVVVDCMHVGAHDPIGSDVLEGVSVAGKAVLFHTNWSQFWGQPDYMHFPYLTQQTAIVLRDRGAKLVGVDCLVIDSTDDPRRPVHNTLLHSNILIVENLTNLMELPPEDFIFHAAPVKIAGAATFPVRAYAVIP